MTTASTTRQRQAAIFAWAHSASQAKHIAAVLARELSQQPPGTPVESSMKIASRFQVSNSMAVRARRHLLGANIIRRNDASHHYHVT